MNRSTITFAARPLKLCIAVLGLALAGCTDAVGPDLEPASVQVQPEAVAFDALGATSRLTAVARDGGEREVPTPSLTWTSSATDVATVDASGLVTAVAEGDAMIRAFISSTVKDSAAVQVRANLLFSATLGGVDNGVVEGGITSAQQTVTVKAK